MFQPPLRNYNPKLLRYSASKLVGMALRGVGLALRNRHMVLLGSHTRIVGRRYLELGRWVKIEDFVEMQCVSECGVQIGDHCSIGRGTQVLPSGFYSGELGGGLVMLENSSIGPFCFVGAAGLVKIGRNVITGPNVALIAQNHRFDDMSRPIRDQGVTQVGIEIGDGTWIGAGAIILDGVTVGANSVIAAGAVINKDVPPGSVVGGVPGKVLRLVGESKK